MWTEILPYIERDAARHVGLGILYLPGLLSGTSPRQCRRLSNQVGTIGDLFTANQLRYLRYYRALGLEPRDLIRRADKVLFELARKLGTAPGTDQRYFRTDDPSTPEYEAKLEQLFPKGGDEPTATARMLQRVIDFGAATLPS